jgi:hypothetical protein
MLMRNSCRLRRFEDTPEFRRRPMSFSRRVDHFETRSASEPINPRSQEIGKDGDENNGANDDPLPVT